MKYISYRFTARCDVQLLIFECDEGCIAQRRQETIVARQWYQITNEKPPRTTEFPLTFVPWLDQTLTNTQIHYSFDDFEAGYMGMFGAWVVQIAPAISKFINGNFANLPYESIREFIGLNQAIKMALLVSNFWFRSLYCSLNDIFGNFLYHPLAK